MPRKRRQLGTLPRQSAAASWDLILHNDAVLTEILLRLPAKSLIRFKSVCKKWLSLISSDYFCHQHTLRCPLQPSLIIGTPHARKLFYFNGENAMIPYRLSKRHRYIQNDCNGLLLLKSDPREAKYYVYNPTTRQSRKIALTQSDKFPFVEAINLAFDPSKSPYYKVICVRSTSHSSSATYAYQIEVYDSQSHTWKLSLEPSTCHRIYNNGVHWNNSIIWSTRGRGDGFGHGHARGGGLGRGRGRGHGRGLARGGIGLGHGDGFCCFDIAKNEIKNLSFPPGSSYSPESFPYLQESNGHLYCFKLVKGHQNVSVAVWEFGGDDHSQWLSKHHGEIHPHSVEGNCRVRFVGGWGGDRATCSLLMYENSPPRIMAYNFLDDGYELLVHFPDHPGCLCSGLLGLQFGETLALV